MYSTETEIYSLATCPGTKYSGDTITLRATPRDGIGPYYVAFKKDGIIIDPSRLGGESNPITNAPEDVEITRTYTLNDEDVRNALTGTIGFSVFIRGSCPTGGGLQFDGVNDYVDVGDAASLNLSVLTYSVWFYLPSIPTTKQTILSQRNSYDYHRIAILDTGLLEGELDHQINTRGKIQSLASITTNTWHKVDITYNGSIMSLYLDSILQGTLSFSNIYPSIEMTRIGTYSNGVGEFLNGTIDEARIYNRALSPTEILGLYNGSTPRNGLVLEHIYSLGNANDLSGYGNNGTPVNGPVFIPNACMDTCTVAIGCIAPVCNFVVT